MAENVLYRLYEWYISRGLSQDKMPKHVAIIMDGNRRFSKLQGNIDVVKGHEIGVDTLEKVLEEEQAIEDIVEQGYAIRDKVLPTMESLREACDQAEMIVAKEYWPYPSYGEMLFGVK